MKFLIENIHRILFLSIILYGIFCPFNVQHSEFPIYRIVLDPGHGGLALRPQYRHGDRYDDVREKYLDLFREGAAYRNISERKLVYTIAKKTFKILMLCTPDGDYQQFEKILKKYTKTLPQRVYIDISLSRGKSISYSTAKRAEDPNEEYRMFDFPSHYGYKRLGRLSKINNQKPHLVLSLHAASAAAREYSAINPVIVPPYSIFKQGLLYLKGKIKNPSFFYKSPYKEWFIETVQRNEISWFLNDTSLYFTGFPLTKNRKINHKKFRGYRYNMVSWRYKDSYRWDLLAQFHPTETQYADDIDSFIDTGPFFRREQSLFEQYRRAYGPEGFGGDNCYASYEIIRFILYSLDKHGVRKHGLKPGKPFFSAWSMPLHMNAINPFLELGYFRRNRDRRVLTKHKDAIAEGIAIGIYSLLTGLDLKKEKITYRPQGKRIDLEKYQITEKESYFDRVVK